MSLITGVRHVEEGNYIGCRKALSTGVLCGMRELLEKGNYIGCRKALSTGVMSKIDAISDVKLHLMPQGVEHIKISWVWIPKRKGNYIGCRKALSTQI